MHAPSGPAMSFDVECVPGDGVLGLDVKQVAPVTHEGVRAWHPGGHAHNHLGRAHGQPFHDHLHLQPQAGGDHAGVVADRADGR